MTRGLHACLHNARHSISPQPFRLGAPCNCAQIWEPCATAHKAPRTFTTSRHTQHCRAHALVTAHISILSGHARSVDSPSPLSRQSMKLPHDKRPACTQRTPQHLTSAFSCLHAHNARHSISLQPFRLGAPCTCAQIWEPCATAHKASCTFTTSRHTQHCRAHALVTAHISIFSRHTQLCVEQPPIDVA